MIETEIEILKIIFPPQGAVPLDRLDNVPLIRNHIASIIDLSNGHEQRFRADESAAITAKIVELRETPGPDGLAPTWATIAALCHTSVGGARKRYATYKRDLQPDPTIRESRIVETPTHTVTPEPETEPPVTEQPKPVEAVHLQEAKPAQPETPAEPAQKTEEPPTIRKGRTVEKAGALSPETLAEVDRMLSEGMGVQEISRELERQGKIVPWTKVRARAAVLARTKKDAPDAADTTAEAPTAEEEQPNPPTPTTLTRQELDQKIWALHKAGKTLEEISDILYSEGLYYSAKSVRIRLLNQGAKL